MSIPDTNTQVQEYLKGALNLKLYSLEHYPRDIVHSASNSVTQEHLKLETIHIGLGLGRWLRNFHNWGEQPEQAGFRAEIQQNKDMQALKHTINYEWLVKNVEKHASSLGDARTVFEKVRDMAKAELADEESLRVIHGDFWTGKYVLIHNQPCYITS